MIQKLKPPASVKECRGLTGMVNFLSILCPELQRLLKPTYHLTRKGTQCIKEEEQQTALKK